MHAISRMKQHIYAHLRETVDGSGGGEDDVLAAVLLHDLEEDEGAGDVVVVILEGLGDGLAHSLEARKVDDAVDLVLGEDLLEAVAVEQVALDEGDRLADDLGDALQARCEYSGAKAIEWLVSTGTELE